MFELVTRLKAISDMTRLKMLKLIMEQEFSVCELARLLNISQPAVSQHLRRLKAVGLAKEDRRGQWIYYSTTKNAVENIVHDLQILCDCSLKSLPEFNDIIPFLENSSELQKDCLAPEKDKS